MTASQDVAIAVVERNGSFLVGRRPPGVPASGCAEFPGGKVETGERPSDAARRECFEETGLSVEVLQLLQTVRAGRAEAPLTLHFFYCRPTGARDAPRSPFCWVARTRLCELPFPAANLPILELLCGCTLPLGDRAAPE